MTWLIGGLAVWIIVHLVPAVSPALRLRLVDALGENGYRGLFALSVLAGLVCIVIGWRTTIPQSVYLPPAWGRELSYLLMFFSVVLFGASHARTNIKQVVRHPQLTAVLLWAIAHLLANGDTRSLVLFGALGLWALVEIPLLNRRDGPWQKAERASLKSEAIGATVAVIVYIVLMLLHPYFAGVAVMPT